MVTKKEIKAMIRNEAKNESFWIFAHGIRISKDAVDYLANYAGEYSLERLIQKAVFVTFHSGMRTLKLRHVEYAIFLLEQENKEPEKEELGLFADLRKQQEIIKANPEFTPQEIMREAQKVAEKRNLIIPGNTHFYKGMGIRHRVQYVEIYSEHVQEAVNRLKAAKLTFLEPEAIDEAI